MIRKQGPNRTMSCLERIAFVRLICKRISERLCQQSEWRVEESNALCVYEKI
jgi:hypothetical protein